MRAFVKGLLSGSAWWAAVAILFGMAQFRLMVLVIGERYIESIGAAKGVVLGIPDWLLYQSRVLGPYTVELLSRFVGDFPLAHGIFAVAATAVAGYLILALMRRPFGSRAAWGSFFLFHALFALLLNKWRLYAWDHYDLVAFVLFVYFVFSGKQWQWFTVLFAVAIFNRESALFIALWMLLDPVVKVSLDRGREGGRASMAMFIAGFGCMTVGLGVIRFLREKLLVSEVGPERFNLPEFAGKSVQVRWDYNFAFLKQLLSNPGMLPDIVIPLFVLLVVVIAAGLALRDPSRYLALAVTHVALVISLLVLALLPESRALLELVPFTAMGVWALQSETP